MKYTKNPVKPSKTQWKTSKTQLNPVEPNKNL